MITQVMIVIILHFNLNEHLVWDSLNYIQNAYDRYLEWGTISEYLTGLYELHYYR